jgi:hypothetical protein
MKQFIPTMINPLYSQASDLPQISMPEGIRITASSSNNNWHAVDCAALLKIYSTWTKLLFMEIKSLFKSRMK